MRTRRLLVVDDDAHILEVLAMRLSAMGLEVTAARSQRSALAALDVQSFDAALFDLRMEPLNGLAFMEEAHRRQPRLPVLIMTAHGTIANAVEAVQRGAFDYLTKPFVSEELRSKIERALSERRWARDRNLLRAVGEALGSSGTRERLLEAVAQATVEATEAERAAVFLVEQGRLKAAAGAGDSGAGLASLAGAAQAAIEKREAATLTSAEGRVMLAAPLLVDGKAVGAVVSESPNAVAPTEDELELLALFSSQAAAALKNAHDLARLRSGALAALGRMATEVAHELKNPLGGLKLYARHLEHRLGQIGDGPGLAVAQKMGAAIDHLAELVTDITAFGRPRELRREPIDVNGLLEECLALAQDRVADKRIHVERRLEPAMRALPLDARELRKVFLNIIVNALEAMDPGGALTLRTTEDAERGVEITVEDTGTGMSEETRARIFDPFFTTKVSGTGLGMAIARSVVDRHGGHLDVQSEVGRGTRVRVHLPREERA
ncbi:MAG: response regulator [Candidatus Rokubacteria bacterium]|nr:response regulator [Candidatus Rokubacteria bacterium]